MKKIVGFVFYLIVASNFSVMNGSFKASSIRFSAILTRGNRCVSTREILLKKPCCKIMSSKTCALSERAAEFRELMSTQAYIETDIKRLIAVGGTENWTTLDLASTHRSNERLKIKLAKKMCALHKKCILGN